MRPRAPPPDTPGSALAPPPARHPGCRTPPASPWPRAWCRDGGSRRRAAVRAAHSRPRPPRPPAGSAAGADRGARDNACYPSPGRSCQLRRARARPRRRPGARRRDRMRTPIGAAGLPNARPAALSARGGGRCRRRPPNRRSIRRGPGPNLPRPELPIPCPGHCPSCSATVPDLTPTSLNLRLIASCPAHCYWDDPATRDRRTLN